MLHAHLSRWKGGKTVPAWKNIAWPELASPFANWTLTVRKLRHLSTLVNDDGPWELRHGQMLWGIEFHGVMLAVAWDWREVMPDVVVIGDPMSILTNVSFLDEEGAPVNDAVRLVYLNTAVYQLPWQRGVRQAMKRTTEAMSA